MKRIRYDSLIVMILILLLAIPGNAKDKEAGLQADEILVIANKNSLDSLAVARHFMKLRAIPKENLFLIDYAGHGKREPLDDNPLWMPHPEFEKDVVKPLKVFLETKGLKDRILCLVTTLGTPYRLGGFSFTPVQEKALRKAFLADPKALTKFSQALSKPRVHLNKQLREAQQRPSKEEIFAKLSKEDQDKILKSLQMVLRNANASFDSELARLYDPSIDNLKPGDLRRHILRLGQRPNPFLGFTGSFRDFRKAQIAKGKERIYMVARLEGTDLAGSKGLVDKALEAEAKGVKGKAYFDAKRDGRSRKGSALGDWWIRQAAINSRNAGLKTTHTTKGHVLAPGECADALFYWGWYQLLNYNSAAFEGRFPVGAIGCHIASYEAAHLRTGGRTYKRGRKGPWCAGMLRDGITATMGPVAEPFLGAFPHTQVFFPKLFQGGTLVEAYWASIPHTSWMMVLIGDPLYTPYGKGNALKNYVHGRMSFKKIDAEQWELTLHLKANGNRFDKGLKTRVFDPGVHHKNIQFTGLGAPTCQVRAKGRELVVTGIRVEVPAEPKVLLRGLELHLDLGAGLGVKVVSGNFPQK